jgi:hypothetical protein
VVYENLNEAELMDWVERFYSEYYFRTRVIWRMVRKVIFNAHDRKRLTKEAREYMASRMTLLSWADLSYVLPVTSVGYVLVAFVGRWLLDERITSKRWAGILLIVAGVALVGGGSAPRTWRGKSGAHS